ncbi:S-layer homology domain-containing protein [Cohnella faecalis]|uniref:S-layer homology domain-containing protein n=1 Tax=Cohnella faecalis TaxID=2315694 RepID=UPI001F270EF8|nr:S-layer homology domain-containing protein [Cohnella faecalis]
MPFNDIADSYAKGAIVHLSTLGIVSGNGSGKFEPRKSVTRAEWVSMLDRLFAIEPVNGAIPAFADVPNTVWHYPWVQSAVELGLATGTSPSLFQPDKKVSRQEAAVFLVRALKQSLAAASSSNDKTYMDSDRIASWALPSVRQLQKLNVMNGDGGTFRPEDSMTKQEAAALLDKVLQRNAWSAQFQAAPAASIQLGWQYGQTTVQFERQVAQSNVNTLSPRWFFLGQAGTLEDSADAPLVAWAHAQGKKVWAMVGNHSDPSLTGKTISDATQRKIFIQALADAVRKYGLDGLNIDFENVSPQDRNGMTLFVSELAAALRAIPAKLSVNVSPDLGTDWTDAFDYAALGNDADYIVLMGYDEHWEGDAEAGSVSSLPWLRSGLDALLDKVPANKVILAMPLYTRDWYAGAAATMSTEWSLIRQNDQVRALHLKPDWNERLAQYSASYWSLGVQHRIWLEDGRSLSRKMELGLVKNIAGFAYWYMGGDSPDVWASMRNRLRFSTYTFL